MVGLRRGTLLAGVALALGPLFARGGWAEEPPPAPAADHEREAALQRAQEVDRQCAVLYGQGKYAEATPLVREALGIREQALGPDHPGVAPNLSNLALLLSAQGAYTQARPLCERALAIHEKTLGPNHPDVAWSLNNLAMLRQAQGAHAEARPLFERALAIQEKALGQGTPPAGSPGSPGWSPLPAVGRISSAL